MGAPIVEVHNDSAAATAAAAAAAASAAATYIPPIRVLALIWFVLCTFLVTKHMALVTIFFSFVGCFGVAAVLQLQQQQQEARTTALVTGKDKDKDKDDKKDGQCANSQNALHAQVKTHVGWAACAAAAGVLVVSWPGAGGGGFQALSIAAGSLAFDLWYSLLYCPCHTRASILELGENAIFLTLFLFLLVRDQGRVERSLLFIVAWIVYRVWRLPQQQQQQHDTNASVWQQEPSRQELNNNDDDDNKSPNHRWQIHGVEYDLNDFVNRHPGGREAILLGRGRDCTALFESYHPFTNLHWQVLSKYQVAAAATTADKKKGGTVEPPPPPPRDEFYEILKTRVARVLRQEGIDPIQDRCANLPRTLYYALVLLGLVLSGRQHVLGNPWGSLVFALFAWIAGAQGHDAGHFAVSRQPLWNDVSLWCIGLLNNPIVWQHQHTFAHHSHTNDWHRDPDLHHFMEFLRVHRRFAHSPVHANQSNALYVFGAYTLVVFGTCLRIPLAMMTSGKLNVTVDWTDRDRPLRVAAMVFHWIAFVAVVIVAPLVWGSGRSSLVCRFLGVVLHLATSGLLFAVFSQVNHLNEPCLERQTTKTFSNANDNDNDNGNNGIDNDDETTTTTTTRTTTRKKTPSKDSTLDDNSSDTNHHGRGRRAHHALVENSWAVEQVETSNNFATGSSLWFCLSNGLNFQIEHHLFPGLNHCHLHHIAPTVKATCLEFGVLYKEYDSWQQVMQATLAWLDKLSVVVAAEKEEDGNETEACAQT